ncbi:unnamed protein product [Spirodela intermedia]|uniref:DUF4005 domain-containing protein n=1 Tax=Spirodela intermedia TaxID=51605 RepID=A0A7I8JGD0_SPIIN|nr:unnamed protein product [Spirodela intermedia]CAA6668452.1 unnamed protein product [Spirodela intermedia]
MGRKGKWIVALKRVFSSTSNQKPEIKGEDGSFVKEEEEEEKKKKKKRDAGKPTGNCSTKSATHLHKRLSGIERILGEAKWERHGLNLAAPKREGSSSATTICPSEKQADEQPIDPLPRIAIRCLQRSAIRIQAAYRGYKARKSFRALLRLHRTIRGPGVMRQTMNAMRLMQLVTRVQSQICQRRAQGMAETRWEWDASLLSTEELNARLERALAYATSHQMGQSAKERAATPLAKANAPTWEQAGRHRRSPRFGHDNHMMNWEGSCHLPLRDDESLTSCPAFTVPSYMAPTLSARAKVKDYKFYKESPKMETKKRFSFGLTQNIETLKWKKSSQPATKESNHQIIRGKHRMTNSLGSLSVESTASLPVGIRRKPFE